MEWKSLCWVSQSVGWMIEFVFGRKHELGMKRNQGSKQVSESVSQSVGSRATWHDREKMAAGLETLHLNN